MYDKIQICNRALSMIAQNTISSLDEGTKEAKVCSLVYPLVKSELLSSYPWKCALATENIGAIYKGKSKIGYQYQILLPKDCLKIITVNGENHYIKNVIYAYTNYRDNAVIYIRNIPEIDMSPSLGYLLALKLALELSYGFSISTNTIRQFKDCYDDEYRSLVSLDSQEGINTIINTKPSDSWINSR